MEKKIFGTSLEAKTRVLVFNIACGLLSLAVISYVFFYSLKYDYNTLFAEHHQSLVELEELRQILNNIENRSNNTTLSQSQISKLQDEIKKHWDSYKANETKNSQRSDLILLALRIYDFFDKRNTILKEKEKLLNKQRDFNKLDSSIQIFWFPSASNAPVHPGYRTNSPPLQTPVPAPDPPSISNAPSVAGWLR